MVTLNKARLIVLLQTYLGTKMAPSPEVVNRSEAVILGTGMSGNTDYRKTLLTENYGLHWSFLASSMPL
jgi:hypothetical protein